MSIKTLRKRIALVAVSALGVGLMSVVAAPVANAASTLTLEANGAVAEAKADGSGTSYGLISGAGAVTTSTAVMYDSGTLALDTTGAPTANNAVVTVTGGTITSFAGTGVTLTGLTTIGDDGRFGFTVKPNAAGTLMVIKIYDSVAAATSTTGGTLAGTLTVTVTTAANDGAFSAARSFAYIAATAAAATGDVATNADVSASSYVANGGAGIIRFKLNDVNGLAMSTATVVSASATNGAVVSLNGTTFSTSISGTYGGSSSHFGNLYVAQGVANSPVSATVVTLSVNGTTYVTKNFKLVGDVDKIELSAASRGLTGGANAAGFYLAVKDSAGNLISSITPSVTGTSINASVTAVTPAASANDDVSAQAFTCSATRGTGTITYTYTNARNQTITSNALPVVCAGNPYKYTASLDAASYKQGSIATLTIKATDVDGNPVSDYSVLGSAGAATTISITCGSQMTAVTAPADANTFTAGVKTIKYTVGTTAGSYNCVVDLPKWNSTSAPQTAQTIAYTVQGDGSISNAEVLASIVKLIAAINKQIKALQKSLKR